MHIDGAVVAELLWRLWAPGAAATSTAPGDSAGIASRRSWLLVPLYPDCSAFYLKIRHYCGEPSKPPIRSRPVG